jgi:hypothetical protein
MLMHSPGLAQKVMQAGAHVRLHSTLTPVELAATIRQYQVHLGDQHDLRPAARA